MSEDLLARLRRLVGVLPIKAMSPEAVIEAITEIERLRKPCGCCMERGARFFYDNGVYAGCSDGCRCNLSGEDLVAYDEKGGADASK